MDFIIKKHQQLLQALQAADYHFITFRDYCEGHRYDKMVILRHDVDLLPQHSLRFAKVQAALGVHGSYYFRAVPESWDEAVIKEISSLGHEVGYHYECLTTCGGDMAAGIQDFEKHLKALRQLAEVKTLCMHGSPLSPYDSKDLWKEHSYRDYGLIGEPYFDADFNDLFYLTDTGRRWDGWKVSVRDKVAQQEEWVKQGLVFHSTEDIIDAVQKGRSLSTSTALSNHGVEVPDRVMFTFHPQRWNASFLPWAKELVLQNAKNLIKRFLVS